MQQYGRGDTGSAPRGRTRAQREAEAKASRAAAYNAQFEAPQQKRPERPSLANGYAPPEPQHQYGGGNRAAPAPAPYGGSGYTTQSSGHSVPPGRPNAMNGAAPPAPQPAYGEISEQPQQAASWQRVRE